MNLVVIGSSGSTFGVYATDNKGSFAKQLLSFSPEINSVSGLCKASDGTIGCWSWNGFNGASTGILLHPNGATTTFNIPMYPIGFAISPDAKSYCITAWDNADSYWGVYAGPIGSTPTLLPVPNADLESVLWIPNLGIVYDNYTGNSFATLLLPSVTSTTPTVLTTHRLSGRGFSADGKMWMYGDLLADGSTALTLAPVGKPGRVLQVFPYNGKGGRDFASVVVDIPKQHALYTADRNGPNSFILMDIDLETRQYHQVKVPGIDNIYSVIETDGN